ncbi:hypothetical protein scyTo_0025691 [Scyliorhinus torazame]|uniref:Uncharacterized protein n=1 Tax=Scyliorhinus torazame TaxID=75743 RepID=A0A401QHW4_SCYTO|nr:hypothetical protein [Scyliorhinus torazame]
MLHSIVWEVVITLFINDAFFFNPVFCSNTKTVTIGIDEFRPNETAVDETVEHTVEGDGGKQEVPLVTEDKFNVTTIDEQDPNTLFDEFEIYYDYVDPDDGSEFGPASPVITDTDYGRVSLSDGEDF